MATKKTLRHIVAMSGVQFGTSGARGLVSRMSDDVCYGYAQAFLRAVASSSDTVVLGHDLRPSSPAIAAACAQAVRDAGKQVLFVGALPTPAIAYYAAVRSAPAIIVTGSHIPFDRNGIKFYRADGEITKDDEQAMLEAEVDIPATLAPPALPAVIDAPAQAYLQRYLDVFGAGALAGMRVAVYEHSSVARDILRSILEALGANVLPLGRTDEFVPIDTEAVRAEDIERAVRWAGEHAFDAIVSTDGDADRPLIGDEQGRWLRGDIVGILCSQYLAADYVVTPVSSNTAVERCKLFKEVIRTRIGSPYVIAGMEQAAAAHGQGAVVVGYEANGGFLLGTDIRRNGASLKALPTRDAVLPIVAVLALARERGCRVSEVAHGLPPRFTASDRLQDFATELSRDLIERLAQDTALAASLLAPNAGALAHTDTTDGLRIIFANGDIVHLRPSGNAPELRCYAEASTQDDAEALCQACLGRIAETARAPRIQDIL
jgi:phosphomannomutase